MRKNFMRTASWLMFAILLVMPFISSAQSIFEVDNVPATTSGSSRTDITAATAAAKPTGWVRGDMGVVDKGQLSITQGTVNVRSGPGLSYEILDQVRRGDRFPVIKSQSGWHNISMVVADVDDSKQPSAWLRNDMCVQVGKVAMVILDKVNLRAGPSTSHSIVSTSTIGRTFPVLGEKDGWIQIALISGEKMIERSEPKLVEHAQQDFMIAYNAYTKLVPTKGLNH
ncbi:MAG: SH3 domain-containing protein, partial [Candidatus Riflebacteria bacterium]|nr:SH3 domain-containing protein [Candidatus Riflebacteria bacterium]